MTMTRAISTYHGPRLIQPDFQASIEKRAPRRAGSKLSVLLVDDDVNLRMLLEYVLRREYEVTTREDGLSAMAWLSAGHLPDLIVADVDMPRLNGIELLTQLRASGYFRDIPVVMLSAYDDPEMRSACLGSGATDYLLKPFSPDGILSRLECILSPAHER